MVTHPQPVAVGAIAQALHARAIGERLENLDATINALLSHAILELTQLSRGCVRPLNRIQ